MRLQPLVVFLFLAANFYVYHWFAGKHVIPARESFASWPLEVGEWRCPQYTYMDDETLQNLGASDYLICDYHRQDPKSVVGLYVGYHQTQVREEGGGAGENTIHPPAHCLPGSGWDIIAQRTIALDLPGLPERPARVNRLVIAKGEARQLVYYWYQTQGRVIAEDWRKIVYLTWDRARRNRTDGALVRFTVPFIPGGDGEAEAEAAIRDLMAELLPQLSNYVPE